MLAWLKRLTDPGLMRDRILRAGTVAAAFTAIVVAGGLLNNWIVTQPITRKFNEEATARQQADSLGRLADIEIIKRLENITVGQDRVIDAVNEATYSRSDIDRMKREADRVHARQDSDIRELFGEVAAIKGRLKMYPSGPVVPGARPAIRREGGIKP